MLNDMTRRCALSICLSFIVSICIVNLFLTVNKGKLNSKFLTNILFISDAIYRFNVNSLNSKYISLPSNDLKQGVIVKNSEAKKIRDLSEHIDNLFAVLKINPIISSNLWTVANVYPEYVIPRPFREEYINLFDKDFAEENYLERILKLENIEETLEGSGLTVFETVRVFGPYIEEGTNEELFSIYYPLYLEGVVFSVLVIDVKSNFLNDFIENFNDEEFTWFEMSDKDRQNISTIIYESLALKTEDRKVGLTIKTPTLYNSIAILICTLIIHGCFLIAAYIRKFYVESSIDRLSGFYRKDGFMSKKMSVNSMCLIDIDHFKKINDTYGHVVGDIVIAEVANRIKNSMRSTDLAIRWGGEEFVVIFNGELSFEQFNSKANGLLSTINSETINDIAVTISIGAIYSQSEMKLQEAFHLSDEALYESKNSGRNKVTIHRHS
ncbi:diguanylate cyclase [Shewanella pealeana ATCC 700345]|uniref:diguanylate cyclase n=2 Tax=Shewanella pealeana TaxID=70864 RepID=A8H4N0_SHEPA|nr:diguanylate cyclase [Shewanella pealeana ATCC 700345]